MDVIQSVIDHADDGVLRVLGDFDGGGNVSVLQSGQNLFEFFGVAAVTGGIGVALIATACGLGIAIFSLVPFNYFTGRVARLQFELEAAATNVQVMVHRPK